MEHTDKLALFESGEPEKNRKTGFMAKVEPKLISI